MKLVQHGYGAKKIFNQFKQSNWRYGGDLVSRIKKTGGIKRKLGSGRPRTSRIKAKGSHIETKLL